MRNPSTLFFLSFSHVFANLRHPTFFSFFPFFFHLRQLQVEQNFPSLTDWQPQVGLNPDLRRNCPPPLVVQPYLNFGRLAAPQVGKKWKIEFSRSVILTLWRAAARLKPLRRRAPVCLATITILPPLRVVSTPSRPAIAL